MQHSSRFLALVEKLRPHVKTVTAEDLLKELEVQRDFILLDVREKEEFQIGHLPHAVHLSKGVIERDIERLIPDVDADIVVYCSGGLRSVIAAYNLQEMGYRHVRSLLNGSREWMMKGLPCE